MDLESPPSCQCAGLAALPRVAKSIHQSVVLRRVVLQDGHEIVNRQREEAVETATLKMTHERVDIIGPVSRAAGERRHQAIRLDRYVGAAKDSRGERDVPITRRKMNKEGRQDTVVCLLDRTT